MINANRPKIMDNTQIMIIRFKIAQSNAHLVPLHHYVTLVKLVITGIILKVIALNVTPLVRLVKVMLFNVQVVQNHKLWMEGLA